MCDVNVPQQVVDAILAGVRTANVDVKVSPDGKECTVTVVSPVFDNLPQFKRRDMVQKSLGTVRTDIPTFASCRLTALHLYSPSEISEIETQNNLKSIEQ